MATETCGAQAPHTARGADAAAPAQHPPAALQVLHQDRRCLAVHKPAGLLVHRSALDAHANDDAVTRLRQQLQRPLWPVHRLDKGTSGVLLLALDVDAARLLGQAFADGRVDKRYRALVRGWPADIGQTQAPLARNPELPSTGQPQLAAATHWQRIATLELPLATDSRHASTRLALLSVQPLTGRRHQIRRHFKALGHPLIGDATHGKGPLNRALATHWGLGRLWLQAEWLQVPHPDDGRPLRLHSPPDADWQRLGPAGLLPLRPAHAL